MSALIKRRPTLLILVGLLLTACGSQPIPPTVTAAVIIVTATTAPSAAMLSPIPLRILPPTWTLEPTITPRPTNTPQPSLTLTVTQSAQAVCDEFAIVSAPAQNAQLDYDGTVTFTWHGVPDGASVLLKVALHGTGQGLSFSLPVSGDSMLPIPFSKLSDRQGQYDWTISLKHPLYGEICQHSGSFFRNAPIYM